MTIVAQPEFMDGFDALSAAQITRKWTTGSATIVAPGRSAIANSQAISCGLNLRRAVTSTNAGIMQFALKTPASFVATQSIANFYNSASGGVQCALNLTSSGFLQLQNGQTLGIIATATDALQSLVVSTWYVVEFACLTHLTAGTVDVKVNGAAITGLFGLTNKATSSAANAFDSVELRGGEGNFFDDFYYRPAPGGYNNAADFLGDLVIETLYPDAASSNAGHDQGTIYGGVPTRREGIDEINASNDETDGVDLTANAQKLYTSYGSLVGPAGATISTIHGCQVNIIARKTDPGFSHAISPGTFKVGTPGTDYFGNTAAPTTPQPQTLQDTFTDKRATWSARPDGSGAWTTTDFATGWEWGVQRDS